VFMPNGLWGTLTRSGRKKQDVEKKDEELVARLPQNEGE